MIPKMMMLVGLPAAGKSFLAKTLNANIFSSDAIRAEVFGDVNDQTHNTEVFNILHKRIVECLKNGEDCVYDATNLSARRRKAFLNSIAHIKCQKVCYVIATPIKTCIERNLLRERRVPIGVIQKLEKNFQMPHKYEGWDEIKVIENDYQNYEDLVSYFTFEMSHDCMPYHYESIQKHMLMAAILQNEEINDPFLNEALLFHDIGKIFTKQFKDSKGNPSEVAHYYQHENVSAYRYLTSKNYANIVSDKDKNEILYLIQFHMEPYKRKGAAWDKFAANFSEDFIEKLLLLNKYDNLGRKKGD